MKRNLREVVTVLATLGLCLPAGAWAAERDPAGSPTESGGTGAGSPGAKAPSKKLSEGLQKLHAGNQAEIQGGKLAQQAAASADVKAFGQKMIDDHSQNDQQLTTMAGTLGVSLTGEKFVSEQKDAQKKMSKVEKKTGAEFDKAYIEDMVKDHQKDTKMVKSLADDARKEGQTEVATFLDQTEQVMQGHLAQAKQLESAVKNEKKTASKSKKSASGQGTGLASPPPGP